MHYGRGQGKELEINIRVYCTQYRLIIAVTDNGKGMSEETLKALNEKLNTDQVETVKGSRGTGIGLLNINERIKVLFGSEYGITVYSMENIGTKVEVSLPLSYEAKATA